MRKQAADAMGSNVASVLEYEVGVTDLP